MQYRFLAAIAGLIGLSACGGGGGGIPEQSYADMFSTGQRIFEAQAPQDWTTQQQLRTTGTARYNGVFIAELDAGAAGADVIQGAMRMDADFDGNSVSGAIGSVANSSESRLVGTIGFEGGTINRSDDPSVFYIIEADIEGTLTAPDQSAIAVDAEMFANFVGDDAQYVVGEIGGVMDDGTVTAAIVNSTIVLER